MATEARKNEKIADFEINDSLEFDWTVYPHVPKPGGGGKEKMKLKVRFRHVTRDKRFELLEKVREIMRKRALESTKNPQSEDEIDAAKDLTTFQDNLLDEAIVGIYARDKESQAPKYTLVTDRDFVRNFITNEIAANPLIDGYRIALSGRDDLGN